MKGLVNKFIKVMLVAIVPLAFASCEINGPLAHYQIVVNDRLTYLPADIQTELSAINSEFAAIPCERKDAIERFDKFCYSLQSYYDENEGKLLWTDLAIDICLYNKTSYEGKGEGLLVKSHIITYNSK